MSRLRYITTYYESVNPDRKHEVLSCIIANLNSGFFHSCILLIEGESVPELELYSSAHVQIVYITERPSYRHAFQYCDAGMINIVANSDILFTSTIRRVRKIRQSDFFAISRYEKLNSGLRVLYPFRGWTQDVWIVKGVGKMEWGDEDFYFGQPGCDQRIAYVANCSGYEVTNPAFSICTIHMHQSLFRQSIVDVGVIKSQEHLYVMPGFLRWYWFGTSDVTYWITLFVRKIFLIVTLNAIKVLEHLKIRYLDKMF